MIVIHRLAVIVSLHLVSVKLVQLVVCLHYLLFLLKDSCGLLKHLESINLSSEVGDCSLISVDVFFHRSGCLGILLSGHSQGLLLGLDSLILLLKLGELLVCLYLVF